MNLLIRADADTQTGTGHVMRCLALAQAWQDAGGRVTFGTAKAAPVLEAWLQAEGMAVVHLSAPPGTAEDARQTLNLARKEGVEWIVVDGYQFQDTYQRIIKEGGRKLLCIDDYGHAHHYYADIVLNQNLSASERFYRQREPYTRLLLGTGYVLLRREFLQWRHWQRETPEVAGKVLVTLGGGDPANVTLRVLQAIGKMEIAGLEAIVLVGASNPHFEELNAAVQLGGMNVRLQRNVKDMAELMAWAEVAVSAGGITCWELAFMGLPHLIIVLAANQAPGAEILQERGVALNAGWFDTLEQAQLTHLLAGLVQDKERRLQMSRRGRLLVNGQGPQSVVKLMLS
ncbi:MAG: UDP-2,4-diacetamido-2,4,6-trideoxy-beta-L-altropyranose hydrolase [Deltaproteobacteria bacterium RBG_13_60_28]|nr:MAG: UDP-2,4-diacetamido-2,4,6-trideoxy-beta-L-altropyranose hydrolase [Deltaproteobacteria bacterium RBG_13_60_28]